MVQLEHLTSALKRAGLRLTPQRIAICRLLCESPAHPTAAAIHEQLRQECPSLSQMTVYNTLNSLVALGVVNALGGAGDGNVHYDSNTSPHVNLACISCHKIVDMESSKVAGLDREIHGRSGFEVVGARIMYYGLCPECQRSAAQAAGRERRMSRGQA